MATQTLERTVFETSRAGEYFNKRELQAQTGQSWDQFAAVILKELTDNALDGCETVGVRPEIDIETTWAGDSLRITVGDNGAGIQPGTVRQLLNFATRTSDKAAYRSPTRGAQGNALKTVIGIPAALGLDAPIVIEAQGVKHTIRAWVDPAGEVRMDYSDTTGDRERGTSVQVTIPSNGQILNPCFWSRAFALFNPHASVRIQQIDSEGKHGNNSNPETKDSYHPLVTFPGEWRKALPTDLTSPWWYDQNAFQKLAYAHMAEARKGGKDLPLRDFVRQFRGLSGSAKAKAVCDQFPGTVRLSHFEGDTEKLETLRHAMRQETTPPTPGVLGLVGEEQIRSRFETWYGVKRLWYRKTDGLADGIPFVFEVAVAETHASGRLFTGINFSPTFEDPLAGTALESPEFRTYGVNGFLSQGHLLPHDHGKAVNTAAAIHLICPALEFLDRGKTRLTIPKQVAEEIGKALWRVVKDLYQEEERRQKDAAKAERTAQERERHQDRDTWTLRGAVFHVLPQAVDKATGGGQYPVSARTLFYQVRPLIQHLTSQELDYSYFSQELLIQYRDTVGPISGLYYDPRGVLYEPHTGQAVQLGTREVDAYQFPTLLYNKILYVEKKGLWPILQAAKLAERYDMAVIAAEGYATEAARTLFANADKNRSYQLFVLHDSDPAGYNIARTLAEATRRMPGYRVDVVDLGLKLEEALAMGLQTEEFTRKKALPEGLTLTDLERKHFEGRPAASGKHSSWICRRIELNALSAPELVGYVEKKLQEANAAGKVIPEGETLAAESKAILTQVVAEWVREEVAAILDTKTVEAVFRQDLFPEVDGKEKTWVETALAEKPETAWREALQTAINRVVANKAPTLRTDLSRTIKQALVENHTETKEDDVNEPR